MAPSPPVFYLIPGLGADERVLQFLHLRGEVHLLHWLAPETPDESLPHYAVRFAAAVPVEQACWLVGISFGGLLALEVAKLRPRAQVVLISSLANTRQLPPLLRLARATRLYRVVPPQLLKLAPRLAQWFFGAKNGKEYTLLHQIIDDTDPVFAQWAIAQLLGWDSTGVGRAIRIHGTHDRLLPAGTAPIDYPIAGGGHFMIVSHAAQISRILNHLAAAEEPQVS
ncbi:alpha/beta hydrolase [Hymenobacter sp. BT770]|uniref:alpha/beta hydrolase n=1 Tax=Hymenobacter sp. BT770 TaxID=2886942 RepID=UPI001D0FE3A0|nr:alpha/beta hydrolase [Hymenobacter sp. BT770]MCC3154163.1 alpha/beta hydrolase [Hymenobacter sp. BT770]MDO3414390.1 alpha/beta hydrolase [Hymenobacter sp. BT770]